MSRPLRFAFISVCREPWGGSEELWWATACRLRVQGHDVAVLKTVVDDMHPRIRHLRSLGCSVTELERPGTARVGLASLLLGTRRPVPRAAELSAGRGQMLLVAGALRLRPPDLVVISQGLNFDGAHFGRVCQVLGLEYVLITQRADEARWPEDDVRSYYRRAYRGARSCVFVSERNKSLTEDQLGLRLEQTTVFRNPFMAGHGGPLEWPERSRAELCLACVARLDLRDKGQDLLLRALAQPNWRARSVSVRLYGDGPHRQGLIRLARELGCRGVSFEGQTSDVEGIWRENHALVLPSRTEGLPLALVEALMCGRPAVVTDVGGTGEVVEEGATGFLAASASVADVDAALTRAWIARGELRNLGVTAAQRIRTLVPAQPEAIFAEHLLRIANR